MNFKTVSLLTVSAAFLLFCTFAAENGTSSTKSASSSPVKIAVVDVQKVFQEYEKTKSLEIKLNQQHEVFREYSDQLEVQLLKLKKDYDTALADSQNIAYASAERESKRLKAAELKDALARKEQEIKSYVESRVLQLREMQEKLRGDVIGDIQKTVHNTAVLEGYTLVLDKSGKGLSDTDFILYVQPNLEITESVIQNLNRGYRKDAKNPADAETGNKETQQ